MTADPIPAAQYLRMSTEHQRYSIENQAAAIQTYAELNNLSVVKTYTDPARTGVVLKRRRGLQQLLQDVISGDQRYRVILVLDVTRWGRFQDTDESAHYEFLCKNAGIPVHYCSETFANDGSLPSLIMKALKRAMAGEYSRELSVKVSAGQKRLVKLGFKQGGSAGYGLRRMLVSADRVSKQQLGDGQRKSLATDRVILAPGPENERKVVCEIYRLLVSEGLSVRAIASELNRRGIEYRASSTWDYAAVHGILTQLKYIGYLAFGQTSSKLYTPVQRVPKAEWSLTPGAYEPVVDYATFVQAQQVLYRRSVNKSDDELLDGLRGILRREGRISSSLIDLCLDIPSISTYRARFGSLRHAYDQIGYGRAEHFGPVDLRRRTQRLREELIVKIAETFPGKFEIIRRGGKWRCQLQRQSGEFISVLIARSLSPSVKYPSWLIAPVLGECEYVTLVARLTADNRALLDFYIMPRVDRVRRFQLSADHDWLNGAVRVENIEEVLRAINDVAHRKYPERS
jgi:DNA invertase Pin-like site-specific DNA recombinase